MLIFLAKSCHPEHCVYAKELNLLLLGTDVKGLEASVSECFSPLLSICSSGAISLLDFGVKLENAVIPAIAFCGGVIQFGAVYLIDECFPVLVMLSDVLSPLGSYENQVEICTWLLRFYEFCENTYDLLVSKVPENKRHREVFLSLRYFFKPVRDFNKNRTASNSAGNQLSRRSFRLNEMMRIYECLNMIDGAESCVLFPIGVVSFPSENHEECRYLRVALEKRLHDQGFRTYSVDYAPLLVFEFLKVEELWDNKKPDTSFIADYITKIDALFDLLNMAQIANLDARPANIMWRPISSTEVEIRMIDLEDSFRFGDILSERYVEILDSDGRYPVIYSNGTRERVTKAHNEFFRIAIKDWVYSSNESFSEFVSSVRNAIILRSQLFDSDQLVASKVTLPEQLTHNDNIESSL